MRSMYRIMLGEKSKFAKECFEGGYIGAGFIHNHDLTGKLPDDWRAFNKVFIPMWMAAHPGKSKISAGLACGNLWTVSKGIRRGDLVLCPDGEGSYRVGEVAGDYAYVPGAPLPHRRNVQWMNIAVPRSAMSEALQRSSGSIGTVANITPYASEIEQLIGQPTVAPILVSADPDVEDPVAFAMEKHLEDFLVQNWANIELAKDFDIFKDEGELVGQQYATDVGPIDILAVSKNGKRLLVVELKKGRISDVVVGQIMRYMGYIKGEVAEPGQSVEGVIIALEDDPKLRYALAVAPNISFYRYQVSFKLIKGDA